MTTTRAQDIAFREAFDDVNKWARAIANHVVADVPMLPELVDAYTGACGRLDRITGMLAGEEL